MVFFLNYKEFTQKRCLFECQLKQAVDICKCVPWNYPPLSNDPKLCDYLGVWCFNKVMDEPSFQEKCQCPNDCSVNRHTNQLKPKRLISHLSNFVDMLFMCHQEDWIQQSFASPNQWLWKFLAQSSIKERQDS